FNSFIDKFLITKKIKRMKHLYLPLLLCALFVSCNKSKPASAETPTPAPVANTPKNPAPYGNISEWKCIGGDTMFSQTLTTKHYYTEKKPGCDIYYYELNYPIWSEYDYNIQVSGCTQEIDTLFINDFNSAKIVAFVRLKTE
ncbi:MAG: hypothetical protein ACXVEB_18195, partial [Bacteroidia bacterium]